MRLRRGVSLFEMVIVLALLAGLSAIAIPRARPSDTTQTDQWARVLAQDLDLARTRAFSTRARVRAVITDVSWALYLDDDRDGTINELAGEQVAFGGGSARRLEDGVARGRGLAPVIATDLNPAVAPSGPVRRIEFGPSGTTEPLGSSAVIYLTNTSNARAVRAVEVSPSANVRVWRWVDGAWR
jgi:prepilin-type N-terminal cleavage/methylation domain-containing protein